MHVIDPELTRTELQAWADKLLVPLLARGCQGDCCIEVRYLDRGLGFPQTVNNEPAPWHVQAWHYELDLIVTTTSEEHGYALAELTTQTMAADQTLGSRVRDAWVPVERIRREIRPRHLADGRLLMTLPISLFDVEDGPA